MFFDWGNVIVLVIVFLGFIIYRQTDKSYKNIEKIKKFSDMVRSDLEAFVTERTTEIRDIDVELQVHQKTGKEILKRISTIEEDLRNRAPEMESLEAKIADYGQRIEQLSSMTERVDENLHRLHEESEFLDKVARRVKKVAVDLDNLEKQIPRLLEQYQKENSIKIDELKTHSQEKWRKEVVSLVANTQGVSKDVQEFRDFVQGLNEKRGAFLKETQAILGETTQKQMSEVKGDLQDIRAQIKEDLEQGQNQMMELSKEVENLSTQGLNHLQERLETTQRELDLQIREAEDRYSSWMDGLESGVTDQSAFFEKKVQSFQEALESTRKNAQEELNQGIEQLEASLESAATQGSELTSEIFNELRNEIDTRATGVSKSLGDRLEGFESEVSERISETKSKLSLEISNMEKDLEEKKLQVDHLGRDFEEEVHSIQNKLGNFDQRLVNDLGVLQESVDEKMTVWRDQMDAKRDQLIHDTDQKMLSLENELVGQLKESRNSLDPILMEVNKALEEIKILSEKVKEGHNSVLSEMEEGMKELLSRLDEEKSSIETTLEKTLKGSESHLFLEMESRVSEYKKNFDYRLQNLEQVEAEYRRFEENLKTALVKSQEGIQLDFEEFDNKMAQMRQAEKSSMETDLGSLRSVIQDMETTLEDLKSRAYDNVSEKLQVFEDEFFTDLGKRAEGLQTELQSWKQKIQDDMSDSIKQFELKQTNLGEEYLVSIQTKLQEIQNEAFKNLETMEVQIGKYRVSVDSQMDDSRQNMQNSIEILATEMEEHQKLSAARFEQEFSKHDLELSQRLAQLEKDLEIKMKGLGEVLDASKLNNQAQIENAKAEISGWQNRLNQQMQKTEDSLEDRYSLFKSSLGDKLQAVQDSFQAEKEDLVVKSREERQSIRAELLELQGSLENISHQIDEKTHGAMEQFDRDFETFSLEIQKRGRDFSNEVNVKISDFKLGLQEFREESDKHQKKLFTRITEESQNMMESLDEIDRRLNAFTSQTQLFERADTLKIQLQEEIEDIKSELGRLEIRRKELSEMETQMQRIQKTNGEISDKLGRFFAEKKKIEAMEEDFSRVVSLSQSVEMRLQQVTQSHDTLQSVHNRIRQLEEYRGEVDQRYERLERKKELLDSTTDGVDRNFNLLGKIEQSVADLSGELASIPSMVRDLKNQFASLSEHREKVSEVVEKVETLDSILGAVESRMVEVTKAREWLAKTETRMEEIKNEAKEHVQLLGTLSSDGRSTRRGKKGAPAMDQREMVIKLKKEGWQNEQIAAATKISLGEVELILELGRENTR